MHAITNCQNTLNNLNRNFIVNASYPKMDLTIFHKTALSKADSCKHRVCYFSKIFRGNQIFYLITKKEQNQPPQVIH